ncbi:MAG: hypothetical protein ISF22_03180 [Methanomassiliicoccus sp.]|nr:hypothetical protein [Methanomassiliicoccus sp.]
MSEGEGERADKDKVPDKPTTRTVIKEEVKIECIIKINDRGVITIPREVRDKLDVGCGGKLLVVSVARAGKARTIVLMPLNCLGDER